MLMLQLTLTLALSLSRTLTLTRLADESQAMLVVQPATIEPLVELGDSTWLGLGLGLVVT